MATGDRRPSLTHFAKRGVEWSGTRAQSPASPGLRSPLGLARGGGGQAAWARQRARRRRRRRQSGARPGPQGAPSAPALTFEDRAELLQGHGPKRQRSESARGSGGAAVTARRDASARSPSPDAAASLQRAQRLSPPSLLPDGRRLPPRRGKLAAPAPAAGSLEVARAGSPGSFKRGAPRRVPAARPLRTRGPARPRAPPAPRLPGLARGGPLPAGDSSRPPARCCLRGPSPRTPKPRCLRTGCSALLISVEGRPRWGYGRALVSSGEQQLRLLQLLILPRQFLSPEQAARRRSAGGSIASPLWAGTLHQLEE